MRLTIFTVMILLITNITAQEFQESKIDSLRIENKYNLLFNAGPSFNIPIDLLEDIGISYTTEQDYGHIYRLNSFEMNRIKNDINQSLVVFRAGQNKYYLGAVSDVLGYVSTAAAAGLAAYHLYKFRKEYGIK